MLNLRAATAYASLMGWSILPLHTVRNGKCSCRSLRCTSPGKHPLIAGGVKSATVNPNTISAWWKRWPTANIGVACGEPSGIFVLDVDGYVGEESLGDLEAAHGSLPVTIEQLTGGGGRHLLFKQPGGRVANKIALAPGLDVRGDGGYIVVAPSVHVSGRSYCWEISSLPRQTLLADAPDWLLRAVRPAIKRYGLPDSEWEKLAAPYAPVGSRNARVAKLAGCLFRRYVPNPVAREMLLSWNETHCWPPLDRHEVIAIINSIAASEERRRQTAHVTGEKKEPANVSAF